MSTTRKKLARKTHGASRANDRDDSQPSLHPILQMQQKAGNRAVLHLLNQNAPQIQRAPRNGESEPVSAPAAAAGPLIVADDATTVAPGQMRKSEFLEQLRSTVCTTADAALKEVGQSTEGCPYIEQWLAYYTDQEPVHIERALRKYAPEAANATTASEYIPAISNRVRQAVHTWAETGEVTGVPEELAGMLPGAGIGAALSAIGGALGSVFSGIGRALFKRKEGGDETSDPQAIQGQLNEGQPLEATVSSRMGTAFGMDFSGVRVHTDAEAAGLSDQLNARAFTIGTDIAFGPGEYQPGTLVGDALIAHELAHVAQQGGSSEEGALHKDDGGVSTSLEEDADVAAVEAIAATRGGLGNVGRNAMPRLKSQLRLQSCKKYQTNKGTTVATRTSGHEQMYQNPTTGMIQTRNAPDKTEAEADAQLRALGLLSKVTKLAPPTNDYDCHGYTFLDGKSWIDDDQVATILAENGYAETTTPVVGDIVIYWNGGQPKHSGKITEVRGGVVTKITSKWGLLGLYSHAPNDVPPGYGSWKAYHTNRPGGHRLRYER